MASFFLAPDPVQSTFFIPGGAVPGNGAQLFIYVAGSVSTKTTVYKDNAGNAAWSNPIVLDSGGNLPNGGVVWIPAGVSIKAVWAPSNDTDPPGSPYRTIDNIQGVNDITSSVSEWQAGPAPSFISGTSFSLVGDQTANFTIGRRAKFTVTAGTVYGIITNSAFTTLTTVTMAMDGVQVLDSGLSAVSYGLLASTNQSSPPRSDVYPIVENNTDKTKRFSANLANLNTSTNVTGVVPPSNFNLGMPKSYLTGYTMSTSAGTSSTMAIGVGACRDSNNSTDIYLNSSISKNTQSWAVGTNAGGLLDAGTVSSNAWYHFYALQRPDTGVVDVGLSSSSALATLPANYAYSRRIGSIKTNTSSLWTAFTQDGDYFRLSASVLDVNTTNPGANAVTATLASVPTGVNVHALMNTVLESTNLQNVLYLSDLSATDEAAAAAAAPLGQIQIPNIAGAWFVGWGGTIRTNTSAQIRYRCNASDANTKVHIATLGWTDARGRNA